jgi:hypothetical protein
VDERLNAVPYLAGDVFTAADIMTAFSLTTMRTFVPVELARYSGILAYRFLDRLSLSWNIARHFGEGENVYITDVARYFNWPRQSRGES